jgi:hypothetical protein
VPYGQIPTFKTAERSDHPMAQPWSVWHPIATAPKTSVEAMKAIPILGYCPGEHSDDKVRVIWWEPRLGGTGMWYDDRGIKDIVKPSHWMPLPPPPQL